MSAKKKRTKGPKSEEEMNLDGESKQASRRKNKDAEIDDESNLDVSMNENEDLGMANNVEAKTGKKIGQKRVYKSGLCVKCKKVKKIRCHSMCKTCYDKHLKAKREKEGQQEPKHLIICFKCNLLKKHYARNLCQSCYNSARKSKTLKEYSLTKIEHYGHQGICIKCNQSKTLYKLFMCRSCYESDKKSKHAAGAQKCGNCGMLELLELNGFCSECNLDKRVKKMADGSNLIDQDLKAILKSIEKNELILSVHLTLHSSLAAYAKYFEKFSKINIDFGDSDEDESDDANLNEESSGPSKYAIGNKDFINRLKQYTHSKLKPLKKQSGPINTENASSIFNVATSAKSKIKSPSKPKAKRKANLKECIDCKQMKPHSARGRCSACYRRFMRQKKKEDAEKVKTVEEVEEESNQNDETQEINANQMKAPSDKSNKKRAKKQSNDA